MTVKVSHRNISFNKVTFLCFFVIKPEQKDALLLQVLRNRVKPHKTADCGRNENIKLLIKMLTVYLCSW